MQQRVSQSHDVLYYPTLLNAYPIRWWERLTPSGRHERRIAALIDRLIMEGKDWSSIGDKLKGLTSARGLTWQAQLLIKQVADSWIHRQMSFDAGFPKDMESLLEQAKDLLTEAIALKSSYGVYLVRSYVYLFLNRRREVNEDRRAAGQMAEAKGIESGLRLKQQGKRLLDQGRWLVARKTMRRAVRKCPLDRSLPLLARFAAAIETVDDVIGFCRRSHIVTIGRSRVRYCEYSVRCMENAAHIVQVGRAAHLFAESEMLALISAWEGIADTLDQMLADEARAQPEGGAYRKRISEAHSQLKRIGEQW